MVTMCYYGYLVHGLEEEASSGHVLRFSPLVGGVGPGSEGP